MPAIYQHRLTVVPENIDMQGHVNNLVYLRWMQDAAVAHSHEQGWGREEYEKLGCGWVVRSHQIDYALPAFEGDKILVLSWLCEFRKATCVRRYRILREEDSALLAHAETSWAFINMQKRLPSRIPAEVLDSFQLVTGDQQPT